MTNFLEVGSIREGLHDILESARRLQTLLAMTPEQRAALEAARLQQGDLTTFEQDVWATLGAVIERAEELTDFLDRFESDPVIYTGEGSTAEVLAMLERLMALTKGASGRP